MTFIRSTHLRTLLVFPRNLLCHLDLPSRKRQTPLPQASISENFSNSNLNIQHQDNDDVYSFDTLENVPAAISGNNLMTANKTKSDNPQVQSYDDDDDIYSFDNLEAPPTSSSSTARSGPSSPLPPSGVGGNTYDDENEIYSFDNLDPPPRVPPPPAQQILSPAKR